ncbi:MAG: polyprenyl synthetase family protein, partial [Bacteroidales bacterium]|nr:polyprenyl synthetase family protein [Bacteroidales bacterium]
FYFNPLFPDLDTKILKKVAFYGYIYFRSIIAFDNILDFEEGKSGELKDPHVTTYRFGIYYLEEAMKGFKELFPKKSEFWDLLVYHQEVYFQNIIYERKFSNSKIKNTLENYEKLAWEKNVLSILSIVALSSLAKKFEFKKKLEHSLIKLHVAFQLRDDIADFRKDYQSNQKSYIYFDLKKYLKSKGEDITRLNQDKAYKYFIKSGLAIKNLKLAKHYLIESKLAVDNLPIEKYKELISHQILEIDNLIGFLNKK